MSTQTIEIIEKMKTRFAVLASSPDREKLTSRYIVQYNITLNQKVVHTVVLDLKEIAISEVPKPNDIEITIVDEDVLPLFEDKTSLVELKATVSLILIYWSIIIIFNHISGEDYRYR